MGGYGSGRPSRKQKLGGVRALNIYKMKRLGCLAGGSRGHWIWSQDDEEVARIGYHCDGTHLVLDYKVRQGGGPWEEVTQSVPLERVDCNYGGHRVYARCPGILSGRHCKRRVGKLYAGGKYFLCRHCYDLAYNSQSEDKADRALRRANKIRMALGGEPGMANWIVPKPKGMWQQTYQRKRWAIESAEYQANLLFLSKYRHVLSKQELEMYFGD